MRSSWNKGLRLSDAHRAALRKAWKTRPPVSAETIEKIRRIHIGAKRSAETRARISASMKGKNKRRWSKKMHALMRATWVAGRKGPGHSRGHRVSYNGVVFRSTYEARFAKALDALKIRWIYEPKRFDLGTITYCPDFKVPKLGGFVEVKGWLDKRSQQAIKLFRDQFPELPLIVATNSVIRQFEMLGEM